MSQMMKIIGNTWIQIHAHYLKGHQLKSFLLDQWIQQPLQNHSVADIKHKDGSLGLNPDFLK